jgi:RNA polymerase-binding transcription factor DksA
MKGPIMNSTKTQGHVDQLHKRREEIAMTLRHLGKERDEVERNTEWISPSAYKKRAQLLSHVHSWYMSEIDEIDKALRGATRRGYGLCLVCQRPIEQHRLAAAPDSKFCGACETRKDHEAEL